MRTLRDLVEDLIELTPSDLHLVADMLSASCPYTAECLKDCIGYAQQELDALEMRGKQHEEASKMADMDSQYYGERV